MKILFNTYPMAFHTPGGGEVQLLNYQKYLSELNVEVSLFNLWKPEFLKHDIVHFFSVMGGSQPFDWFVKQLNLPLIITSSLWITEETKNNYPYDDIKNQLQYADKVITNSNIESSQLAKVFNFPISKFATVYNGVDPLFFESISEKLFREKFNIDFPFILNVANIEPRKNQLNFLHALQNLKKANNKKFGKYKLINIGHMRDPHYGKQCLDLGKDDFLFLGPLDHYSPLLRSAYGACDLFALPSTLETPGLAALEAAAQGANILVTGVGATREYFEDLVTYIDLPNNIDEIQNKITMALEKKETENNNIKKLQKKMQEQFAWRQCVEGLVRVYREVIK